MRRQNWSDGRTSGDSERILVVLLSALTLVLVTSLIWAMVTRPKTAITVTAAAPAELSTLQRAGADFLLGRFAAIPTRRTGAITVSGETKLDIDLAVTSDGRDGAGTVVAGRVNGQVASVAHKVFMRGSKEFWAALGATNPPSGVWVLVPVEFTTDHMFLPSSVVQAKFTGPDVRSQGDTLTAGDSSADVNSELGLSRISLPGYEVSVSAVGKSPLVLPDGPDAAAPAPVLVRDGGAWRVNSETPPPPPPPADSDPDKPTGDKPTGDKPK